ncbi:MAG: hypothetical protein QXX17_04560 [Conexivisphaerales archaeon]
MGPYASLGNLCSIIRSSIEYSIVMDSTSIEGVERLEYSLIGRNVRIRLKKENSGSLKLHVSDYSEIEV